MKTYALTAVCRQLCKLDPNHPYQGSDLEAHIIRDEIEQYKPIIEAHFPPGTVDVFGLRAEWSHTMILGSGADQVVLLGAGLDLLAHRYYMRPVTFFEVDLASTIAVKRLKLLSTPDDIDLHEHHITYVPCDFESDDFAALLIEHGIDLTKPTMFVWLGVSYYLERQTVLNTLRKIKSMGFPEVMIAMDYALETGSPTSEAEIKLAQMGEPIKTKFKSIIPDIAKIGFNVFNECSVLSEALNYGLPIYDGDARQLMFAYISHQS
jgi:methyltransferase (TIGR00027 family)